MTEEKYKYNDGRGRGVLKIYQVAGEEELNDPERVQTAFEFIQEYIESGDLPCTILQFANFYNIIPQVIEMQNAYWRSTLGECYELLCEIERLVEIDDKDEFAVFLRDNHEKLVKFTPQELLDILVWNSAVGCLDALLNSKLKLHFDVYIDSQLSWGVPIQIAVERLSFRMIQLLLQHGAPPDFHPHFTLERLLDEALNHLSCKKHVYAWKEGDSFFKLFTILSLPEMKEPLDTIRLLASQFKQVENCWKNYIASGQVIKFAALLMAAWDILLVQIESGLESTPVFQYILDELKREAENNYEFSQSETKTNNESSSKIEILVDAFFVLKTFCLIYSSVLERCGAFVTKAEPKCEPLIEKVYELICASDGSESSTVDKRNIRNISSKLTSEVKELSQKHHDYFVRVFTREPSMGVAGSSASSLGANFSCRAFHTRQDANFNHLKHVETQLSKRTPVKLSSHNVLGFARWVAPIMWLAKRSIK